MGAMELGKSVTKSALTPHSQEISHDNQNYQKGIRLYPFFHPRQSNEATVNADGPEPLTSLIHLSPNG
jgi:hypothetical protein